MNIIRATTMSEILDCIPVEMEIRKKEEERIKLKDMLSFVESQLNLPYFGFYIAYEEKKIVGYLALFYVPIRGMEQIQIMRIWYDHHYKNVLDEFINIIKQWRYETKTQRVVIEMNVNRKGKEDNMGRIKALKRKWGFKFVSVTLERRN